MKLGLISIVLSLGACAETSHRWGFADTSVARAAQPASRGFATASAQSSSAGFARLPAEQPTGPTLWGFAEVPAGRAPAAASAPVAAQR